VLLARFISIRLYRSLKAHGFVRFTTWVSVASVALGNLALILALSILGGYGELMDRTAQRFGAPIDVRSLFEPVLSRSDSVASTLLSIDGVASVEPRYQREALVRSRGGVEGALLYGASTTVAEQLQPLLIEGTWLRDSTSLKEVVIGATLARRIHCVVGDSIVIYTSGNQVAALADAPRVARVRIAGIIRSGMERYDASMVVAKNETLRAWLGFANESASALDVQIESGANELDVARTITRSLGSAYIVQTSRDRFATMEAWIALQREPIPIVIGLISIVAMFTVVAALLIRAVEKVRDIAILRTMGIRTSTVVSIFLFFALRIGALGTAIGCGIALLAILAQQTWGIIALDGAIYFVSVLPVSLSLMPFVVVIATTLVLCLLASLAPVAVALRVRPVSVLQFR